MVSLADVGKKLEKPLTYFLLIIGVLIVATIISTGKLPAGMFCVIPEGCTNSYIAAIKSNIWAFSIGIAMVAIACFRIFQFRAKV